MKKKKHLNLNKVVDIYLSLHLYYIITCKVQRSAFIRLLAGFYSMNKRIVNMFKVSSRLLYI